MSKVIKAICAELPQSTIEELCTQANFCEWERQVLLEVFCEPQKTTLDNLLISKKTYYSKIESLERKLVYFLATHQEFLSLVQIYDLWVRLLKQK